MPYLVIAFCFALGGGLIARSKGNSFAIWFLISGVVPGIGILAAIFARSERDEARRACPSCGKVCMLHDALCTRCGAELEFTADTLG